MRKIQPRYCPSPFQIALLRDARAGALRRFGRFWRHRPSGAAHAGMTAGALVKRRLLAVENDFLFLTPDGRAFLDLYESRARTQATHSGEAAHVA